VNITVSVPRHAASILIRIDGIDHLIVNDPYGPIQLSVGNNVTISVCAIYQPFPAGTRNVSFESSPVSVHFQVPQDQDPPPTPHHETDDGKISPYLLLSAGIAVLLVLVAIMFVLNRKQEEVMSWEE
jgi:hypothetical protein